MKISIVIPFYKMPNWEFFLSRCLDSIDEQTYKGYEIVLVNKGKWAENHNAGIRQAQGEYIKFLHMDDYFTDKDSLARMAKFNGDWLITGCSNNPLPYWTDNIWEGNNKLGGPSCLMVKNEKIFFDQELSWLVDCDYYMQLYEQYGKPSIIAENLITIGIHEGQATNLISDEIKLKEHQILYEKYSRT